MDYDLKQVQRALNDRGFGPLVVDGIMGPKTSAAIIAFKAYNGLAHRDYVGPITYAKLMQAPEVLRPDIPSASENPPWFNELLAMIGTHESRDNAELSAWLRSDGATVGDPSVIPWCGDAVQTSLLLALPGVKVPANPYAAINWSSWGLEVPPQRGCILSFFRGDPKDWRGHVGYYAGESDSNFYVLGGNQGNSVTIAPIAKNRLRPNASRWPDDPRYPPTGKRVTMSGGTISTNEA